MSRRNKLPPQNPMTAVIESLSHEGRGVAHLEGKTVFIDGALPDETVRAVCTKRHKRYDEAKVLEILTAAPERVTPRCAHFGVCGGCALQHMEPHAQLRAKQKMLLDNLWHIGKLEPQSVLEPLAGPYWGYRRKARLGVKYVIKKERLLVGFRERSLSAVADLKTCDILHPSVGAQLTDLAVLVRGLDAYDRIAQIEVAVGDAATALVFRNLDELNTRDSDKLKAYGSNRGLQIYLQPGGPDSVSLLWPASAELSYHLPKYNVEVYFAPNDFTQINAEINQFLVDRVFDLLTPDGKDSVLDLFCGLGNFTLPLARRAREVVGVEGDAKLIRRAENNACRNGINNARFHVTNLAANVSAETWCQSRYDKILLDPPRVGALDLLPHIAKLGAARIVYVSCNPATLARDAGILVHEHRYKLISAGVMDMFPHTAHVESIALFERKG